MNKRGRPAKPRTNELGSCIQDLRHQQGQQGWNVRQLADAAKVSYKTLSKLELGRITPRRPEILLKIAKALDVHPDRLLLIASLTPLLRPVADAARSHSEREPLNLMVNKDERRHLENYLQLLRFTESVEELRKKAQAEAVMRD
jgi:transcriptional regulator with XRE-family HTH domain